MAERNTSAIQPDNLHAFSFCCDQTHTAPTTTRDGNHNSYNQTHAWANHSFHRNIEYDQDYKILFELILFPST